MRGTLILRISRALPILLAATVLAAIAGKSRADSAEDALQQRFEARYPQLRTAKDQGKIGENTGGFVEAVDAKYLSDPAIRKLIDEENADRTDLYKIIANQTQATPDEVAQRAGVRNFEDAEHGDYLKNAAGSWERKQ
jgi:uncharacterized protein YdbL (DUF1318 family)